MEAIGQWILDQTARPHQQGCIVYISSQAGDGMTCSILLLWAHVRDQVPR